MIYLDNSATTYPKPLSVRRKMAQALEQFGANPGRGGFKMSLQTAQAVYDVRQKAASFFGAAGPECISFQPSCTQSLNIVIHSLKRGDHVLVTDLEHNAVLRPLKAMEAHGVSFTVVPVTPGDNDARSMRSVMRCARTQGYLSARRPRMYSASACLWSGWRRLRIYTARRSAWTRRSPAG